VALDRADDLNGKKVAVVGGGNVAIDSARMALRLGAEEVHVIYRRTREDMPAYKGEIEAAEQEGIIYHFLVNPTRVIGDGKVTGLRLSRQTLGDFESTGRRKPVMVENSDYTLDVDVVMPAIGQMPDQSWMASDESITVHRNGTFDVTKGLQTSRPNVFAAGDAVLGPATVVEAIAQGNDVAMMVHTYLRNGEPDPSEKLWQGYGTVELTYKVEDFAEAKRAEMPELPIGRRKLPLQKRKRNFLEVELGLPEDAAKRECMRCLRCDLE
jgi:NADPH-dependent glutamate synthase beta subunit-like oxidoreductase